MKAIQTLLTTALVTSLAACSSIPEGAHSERGTPESLLDVSSEIVTVELLGTESVQEIREWAEADQPSRAEIYCMEGDILCDSVEETLSLYGVEYEWIPSHVSEVNLVYERVIAHDCQHHYIDNRINPYNLNHPAFGCSIASNIVQMVSDRRQFVNPDLLGFYDGKSTMKGVQAYRDFDAKDFFGGDQDLEQVNFQGSN